MGQVAHSAAVFVLSLAGCVLDLDIVPPGNGEGAAGGSGAGPTTGGGAPTCDEAECAAQAADSCFKFTCVDGACTSEPDNEARVPCYTGPDGTEDVGACSAGTAACVDGEPAGCKDEVVPSLERCDTEDDDDCDADAADCTGTVEWARVLPSVSKPFVVRAGDDYLVAGATDAEIFDLGGACSTLRSTTKRTFFVAKLGTNGDCLELDVIGRSGGTVALEHFARLPSGRLVFSISAPTPVNVLGTEYVPTGIDGYLLGIDAGPQLAFIVVFQGAMNERFTRIVTSDEGIVVAGQTNSDGATIADSGGMVTSAGVYDGTTDSYFAGFTEGGLRRFGRRIQSVPPSSSDDLFALASDGLVVHAAVNTSASVNLFGPPALSPFTPQGGGSVVFTSDPLGIPTSDFFVFDGSGSSTVLGLGLSPTGKRAVVGQTELPLSGCGTFVSTGTRRGFVAEEDGATCASRTYAAQGTLDVSASVAFAGYDQAGALIVAGDHRGVLDGRGADGSLRGFVEKLPAGAAGVPAWRLSFDAGGAESGVTGLSVSPTSEDTVLVATCESPVELFEEKKPATDPICEKSTYIVKIGS